MAAMEERYKKYLGKAKSVIKTLDPKHNPALVPDVSNLRSTIHEKERIIENLEVRSKEQKKINMKWTLNFLLLYSTLGLA